MCVCVCKLYSLTNFNFDEIKFSINYVSGLICFVACLKMKIFLKNFGFINYIIYNQLQVSFEKCICVLQLKSFILYYLFINNEFEIFHISKIYFLPLMVG